MNVWLVEPYYTGSHKAWVDGYQAHSRHEIVPLTLPGRFWKWRMQGGALTLARRAGRLDDSPDLILASDMLNLPVFLALAGERLAALPVALYFHENQITYPQQPGENACCSRWDLHYGFINFVSALRADAVLFNSGFHKEAFVDELPRFLKRFPDYKALWTVDTIRRKAQVLPLGLDLARLEGYRPEVPRTGRPLVLWNHRWEYDKDPETFFRAIYALAGEGHDFGLLLLGESFRVQPAEFSEALERLGDRLVHMGYVQDVATYARFLWRADLVVSTAIHEFFGAAVVEACACDCIPILPRRLSYPELIPPTLHQRCLYDDFEGLLARLREAILQIDAMRAMSLRAAMARFDWRRLAPQYDDLLEEVASWPAP